MLTVNHSQTHTRVYSLVWLFREVIAKKNYRLRHCLSVRPLISKEQWIFVKKYTCDLY
jgi:hypothetical protein